MFFIILHETFYRDDQYIAMDEEWQRVKWQQRYLESTQLEAVEYVYIGY